MLIPFTMHSRGSLYIACRD